MPPELTWLLDYVRAGGDAVLFVICYLLWRLDRRVFRLEVHMGVPTDPPATSSPATPNKAAAGFARIPIILVLIFAGSLSACVSTTAMLAGAAMLQGTTSLQANVGSTKAGVTLKLPRVVLPTVAPDSQ